LNEFELVANPRGYYSVAPMPTESYLDAYYREKYWQAPTRPHTIEYSVEERTYRLNRNLLTLKLLPEDFVPRRALDIGCGEGFMLRTLLDFGYEAQGIDASDFGVRAHNPACLPLVRTGNISNLLSDYVQSGTTFDLVLINCVLEHVRDPDGVLDLVRELVHPDGHLIVSVPNDFSWLQALAGKAEAAQVDHWVRPPDHLHYFSEQALISLVSEHGFAHKRSIGDFPIEVFLLNEFSNYVQAGLKGKAAHEARIAFENALIEGFEPELALRFWESCSNIGLGRTITSAFARKH